MSRPRLRLLACCVFERELEVLARSVKTELQIHYLEIALHEQPGAQLRAALQEEIHTVPEKDYAAVGLGYGLCNRRLVGQKAHGLPVVIPRAHDCPGRLLGSSKRYLANSQNSPARIPKVADGLNTCLPTGRCGPGGWRAVLPSPASLNWRSR